MKHGIEVTEAGLDLADPEGAPPGHPLLAKLDRAMQWVNRATMVPCMIALVAAATILSYSVLARYFLKIPTEWQDETAVFLLVGATFFSAAYVQSFRGHVGIEAMAGMLPPRVDRIRLIVIDLASAAFCIFFAWKSWTLFHEAWVEKQTSQSTWGPPLWIPYSMMAAGMTLLCLQLLLSVAEHAAKPKEPQ